MPYRLCALWLMVIVTLGLAGCLGSDDSSGGSSKTEQQGQDPTDQEPETPDTRMGYFVDAPVQGLKYIAQSTSGFTDELGGYEYVPGETVTFYLGANQLGTIDGQWMSTPVDLDVTGEATGNLSRNLTRLLVTLDADANPDNGIKLEANAHRAFRSGLLSLNLDPATFASSDAVTNALDEMGLTGLVPLSFTDSHLAETLDYLPNLQTREHIQTWAQSESTYSGNVAHYNGSMEAVRRFASLFWFDDSPHLSLGWMVRDLSAKFLVQATQVLNCDNSNADIYDGSVTLDCELPSTTEIDRFGLDIQNYDTNVSVISGDVLVTSDAMDTVRNGQTGKWHQLDVEHMEVKVENADTFIIEGSFRYWKTDSTLNQSGYKSLGKYVFDDLVFKNKSTGNAFKLIDFDFERFGKVDSTDKSKRNYYLSLNGDVYHYREGYIHVQTNDEWNTGFPQKLVVADERAFLPLGGSGLYFVSGNAEEAAHTLDATLQVYDGYDTESRTPEDGRVRIERYDENRNLIESAFYQSSGELGKVRLEAASWQLLGSLAISEAVADDGVLQEDEDLKVTIPEIYDPDTGETLPTVGVWSVNGTELSATESAFDGAASGTLAQAEFKEGDDVSYTLTTVVSDLTASKQLSRSVTVTVQAP